MSVRIQSERFEPGAALASFARGRTDVGAVVSFTGTVRDTEGTLERMEIEHYPGMTETAIEGIVEEARNRWSLLDVMVIHRFGAMAPGEVIMMVATAAAHRAEAFEAADYLMDYLKSRAPFWKKEIRSDGTDWVAAKDADEAALDRWN